MESAKEEIMHAVKVGIRHASSDYEESPVEKKIRELVEEIIKAGQRKMLTEKKLRKNCEGWRKSSRT